MKLILASSSPRRKVILSRLNIPFKIIKPTIDETIIKPKDTPENYAKELALIKCKEVSNKNINSITIGADTIVVINKIILGKPNNKKDAFKMLQLLNGKIHNVITAVSIQSLQKNINYTFFEKTEVHFRKIPESFIKIYIDSKDPYDKAGSYGIQDWSSIFVTKINGCYDNVVGFPLCRFVIELEKNGINFNEIS